MKNSIRLVICILTALTFSLGTASAQLPPAAETTFTNSADTAWITAGNWDSGAPVASPGPPDDVKIADGLTAFYDADISGGAIPFGTLTIGVGSTFIYDSLGGGNTDFTGGDDIYLQNNSHLSIVSGSLNSGIDYKIASGDSATVTLTGNSDRPSGSVEGAGNIEFIISGSWIQQRWNADNFTGNMTFTAPSGTKYLREFGGWSSGQSLGAGNNTIGDDVRIDYMSSNQMHDDGTLTLVGDSGGTSPKLNMSSRVETIANLVIDSPTGTADTLEKSTGALTVTNTVTFQGTAGTVTIDDTQAIPAGNGLVAANMTFAGTGNWILPGDCGISITGGTITMAEDTVISNRFSSVGGFTKEGAGTMTLADPSGLAGGIIINEGAIVCTTNVTFSSGDYVSVLGNGTSFTAEYGGTFTNIGDVKAAIGQTGYFRPTAAAYDQGSSFRVEPPAAGTVLIIR